MRYGILAAALALLSGCNGAASMRQAANQEYAVESYEQSLEAYRICKERHPDDPQTCNALAQVIDADRRRYDKSAGN
jgi:hypothetical protein